VSGTVVEIRQPGRAVLRLVLVEPALIGRDCDGFLLADPKASRCHARLAPEGDGVAVEDLGSRNGTWVNGERIAGQVRVSGNDSLVIGDTLLVVVGVASGEGTARRTVVQDGLDPRSSIAAVLEAVGPSDDAEPRATPGGTMTILFSDIEESTSLAQRMGDRAWLEALAEHNQVVRTAIRAHGGTEVKTIGDGFMVTFVASARSALECAVAIQRELAARWRDDWPVRVRIGLHTGETMRVGHDVFGTHVNTAARVAGSAAGGQVLVSGLVHDIVRPVWSGRFGPAVDLTLKGLPGVHRVHEVDWTDGSG
jgi:adenylate cyclase